MKIASFDGQRIGLIVGEEIVEISPAPTGPAAWPPTEMLRFIAEFGARRGELERLLASGPRIPLANVRLETPVPWPNKVIAFPANYHEHIAEMKDGLISTFKNGGQGFFLKANSSLSGPADPIELPAVPDREIHHECEMAIIIGKGGRDIPVDRALDHILGYSCLVDVVIRGKEERVMRKSFDSFCPVGPWIMTADEIADPSNIALELRINGEVRQAANTANLIVDIPNMIAMASSVMTLFPGDIIATGTPAGVGPIEDGDVLDILIENVGAMRLPVIRGAKGSNPVWNKPAA
ncbi:fumarylacetoacetate hydrolase family protein [Sphingobium sp. 15-1]|uniref:fumarylacetoacetate hydrolase family protein n=1 Tax=Sphingobium sp. 15-1 TaxID=2729616 RepID=UPI00159CB69C|nr:fumarylacetoacetate hydrolase family protein [Sphingobium sp. 15-1]